MVTRRPRLEVPSLEQIEGVVAPQIIHAADLASVTLRQKGIRHVLIGGLAVGLYGYPRGTKDVDFLVGAEGFDHHGPIVTFKPGVPISIGGVSVDFLEEPILEEEFADPIRLGTDFPIVSIEALVYLKCKAWRLRDRQDVQELIRVGSADVSKTAAYLHRIDPVLEARFLSLVGDAE